MKSMRPGFEMLERRVMMDGDVDVAFSGGDLSLRGDDGDNIVRISRPASGTIRIAGLEKTTVNGEEFVDFAGGLDDVRINTKQDGEDRIEIQGPIEITGDVNARLGPGELVIEGSAGPVEVGSIHVKPGGAGEVHLRNEVIVNGEARIGAGAAFSAVAGLGFVPDLPSATFSNSLNIDNPYFPLVPGTKYTYEEQVIDEETGEEQTEMIIVEVTNDTKTILGVVNRVLRDRVFLDGVLIEDTSDWHSQDDNGNVWYFGEESTDFEYDEDGNLISTSTSTSWEAGVDGAKPGIIMQADPTVGDVYYQEFEPGVALDQGEVLADDETLTLTPLGTVSGVVRTRDISVLSPDSLEHKFYAPGVGLVQENGLDLQSGEVDGTLRLVSVELNGMEVTQLVSPTGFTGTNVTGTGTGALEFFGGMSITSPDAVTVREARFADSALFYSRSDNITIRDAVFDDHLNVMASAGSVGLANVTANDDTALRAGADAFIFDSVFSDHVRIRLAGSNDELVIGGSFFNDLFADGGPFNNSFDDRGDNEFDELKLRRLE